MDYKQYIVFRFHSLYPSGGIKDLEGSYDTIEDVLAVLPERYTGNATVQIVNRDTWMIEKEYQG